MLGQNTHGRTHQARRSAADEPRSDAGASVPGERADRVSASGRDELDRADEFDNVLGVGHTLIRAMRAIMAASASGFGVGVRPSRT